MQSERSLMPDYLRLFALFGIVLVNVQFMAFSAMTEPLAHAEGFDSAVMWLVTGLATYKTYGLFSFMFGVGLGFQLLSAERRGYPLGPRYRNRMIGLILLGVLHGCLFFPGDILVIYGLMGAILFLLRGWSSKALLRMGLVLLGLQMLIGPLLFSLIGETPTDLIAMERDILTSSRWPDTVIFRSVSFALIFVFLLVFQGISALGWFCLGLAAVKAGLIDNPQHKLWHRARSWVLAPAVLASLAAAALAQWGYKDLGGVLVIVLAPFATMGYLGLIAMISRPAKPWLASILRAGGASLSIYLGQSIVLSTIFSGYGFGLWSAVSYFEAVLIAVTTTIVLILLLQLWLKRFQYGPFEILLRMITNWGKRA